MLRQLLYWMILFQVKLDEVRIVWKTILSIRRSRIDCYLVANVDGSFSSSSFWLGEASIVRNREEESWVQSGLTWVWLNLPIGWFCDLIEFTDLWLLFVLWSSWVRECLWWIRLYVCRPMNIWKYSFPLNRFAQYPFLMANLKSTKGHKNNDCLPWVIIRVYLLEIWKWLNWSDGTCERLRMSFRRGNALPSVHRGSSKKRLTSTTSDR